MSESEAESIVKAWKALVTSLENCQVKERRARKSIEEFLNSISSLLRDYEQVRSITNTVLVVFSHFQFQANKNKSTSDKPGKKRRSKAPSTDEEEQLDE